MIDTPNRWNPGEEDPLFSGDDEATQADIMTSSVDDPHDMCECCLLRVLKSQEYGYRDPQETRHLVCEPCADTCDEQERPLPGMPPFLSPQPFIIRLAAFVRAVSKGKPDLVEMTDRAKRVLIPVSELPRAVTVRRKDAGEFVTVKQLCEEWIPAVSGGSLISESFDLNRLELTADCAQAMSRSLGEAIAIHADLDHVNGDERRHETAEAIREAKEAVYSEAY